LSLFNELKRRNVLRVAIAYLAISWLLVQVVETLFPVFGLSNALIRLVVIVLAIGFPLILIFSWLYELTPEGFKKDKDVDHSSSQAHHSGKQLDRAIIIVLTLSLGYFAFDKFALAPAREVAIAETSVQKGRAEALVESYGESSIAVLPFVNMSSDVEQEYFSDGISEELLNLLAKVPKLRVISRSSSFTYRGKDIDIPTIAEQLNVSFILEGSVRKAGTKVRITAQLIEARSDTHLWSDTYDRELSDIFAIQDEISAAIVAELKQILGLGPEVAPRSVATANTEAYEAYLRGRYLVTQRTQSTLEGAVGEFEKAVELDPDYALAHAELAIATVLLTKFGDLPVADAATRAEPHIKRALALDPMLAEAHAAAGRLLEAQKSYNKESIGFYQRAIELNPNYSEAYVWLGQNYNYSGFGQYKEAFAALEKAVQLDPLSGRALSMYTVALTNRSRFAEADLALEKLASINPILHAGVKGYRLSMGGNGSNAVFGYLNKLLLDPQDKNGRGVFLNSLTVIGLVKEANAFDTSELWALFRLGKTLDALVIAEARLAEDPTSEDARFLVLELQVMAGIYDRGGWPYYEEYWLTEPETFTAEDKAALIVMRQNNNVNSDISDLVAAMKKNARMKQEAGQTTGDIYREYGLASYFEGNHEKGLASIKQAVETGRYLPMNFGFLQQIYDDPGFAPILVIQDAGKKRERDKVLMVVCNDNPYAEVWQPEEGTCEDFAAEGETE